jgi:hypothetical protein
MNAINQDEPGVTVESHNNALYTTAIVRIGAFREHVMNLLLCCIETQIANLQGAV